MIVRLKYAAERQRHERTHVRKEDDILGFWKYCRVSEPTRIQMCHVIYLHINEHHNWANNWTKMVKISYLYMIKAAQTTMNTHWTSIIFKQASLDRSEVKRQHRARPSLHFLFKCINNKTHNIICIKRFLREQKVWLTLRLMSIMWQRELLLISEERVCHHQAACWSGEVVTQTASHDKVAHSYPTTYKPLEMNNSGVMDRHITAWLLDFSDETSPPNS